ncbi:MAG: LysM peptidoglycan-binding domain-containing protein [Firmicutes bacterium]|jgi:LysM repeat protein|nr:LysM peptidoglycan-binding domain-containing protein [Bacillota bacterium]
MDSKGNFPKREERVPYGRAIPNEIPKKNNKKSKKKLSPYRQKYNAQHNIKPIKRKKILRKGMPAKNRRLLTLIIGILAVVLLLLILFRQNGKEVFIGETSMGIVKDKSITPDALTETLLAQLRQEVGANIQINETIDVKPVHISKSREKDVCKMEYLIPSMRQKVTYLVEAAAITVDGKEVVIVENQEEANAVFESLQSEYIPEDASRNIIAGFKENVQVVLKYVDPSVIVAKENAIQTLKSGTKVQKTYTVQAGDALYKIAALFEMTQEELKAMNADTIPSNGNLQVGWVLNVMAEEPMVSVKTEETVVLTEVQERKTVYQQDNTKNKGYQKVTEAGKDGQKEITKKITRINNEIISEEVVDEKTTVEPIDEIIVQGTK